MVYTNLNSRKRKQGGKKEETKHKICLLHVFIIHYSPEHKRWFDCEFWR